MPRRLTPIIVALLLLSVVASPLGTQATGTRPLSYWGWLYTIDCLKVNLDEFNQAYPDIKVTFRTLSPADIYLRLPSALSTGNGIPGVVVLEDSHLPQMMATGGLLDLTGLAGDQRARFTPAKWATVLAGGHLYALPWDCGPVALFYRRDVFARAGLPSEPDAVATTLDTWEDLYRAAKIIKEKTGASMFSLAGNSNDGRLFEILLQQQGLGYFDKNGNVIFDSAPAIRTLDFLGRMYKEGLTQDSPAWSEAWQAGIRDGTVATVIGAAWMDSFIRGWIAAKTTGLWGVVPLPAWSKGTGVRTANDGGTSLAVPKRSPQTEAAWAFIQFMLARKESQVNMMKKCDSFPALVEAHDDPYFREPHPFYDGQPIRKVFADLAGQIPEWYYTEDYALANSLCSAEIQAFLRGTQDAKAALAKAARAIRTKTNRK